MKILHVMAGAERGGAETFFQDSLVALHDAGIEQSFVTRDNHPHKIKLIKERGLPLKTPNFNNYWPMPTTRAIKQSVKEFNPDLIQYWMGRAGQFSVDTAALGSNAKSIGWYGGYYKPSRYKNVDVHVGVTEDIERHIVRKGVPAENAFTLHTYAEFEQEPPVSRADFDTPEDAPLLLALSRLHDAKAMDIMLDAMVKIPGAYLWIAGSGPLEAELKKQCTDLGLDDRVRFLGWREDRGALLDACDICVFPSRYEAFGTVTVEAWGRGVPLVVTKAAGPKAFVNDGVDGLLVEIDDVDGLAAAVNRVINNDALAESLKAEGLKSYEAGFTKAVFQKKAIAFYQRVLDLKR